MSDDWDRDAMVKAFLHPPRLTAAEQAELYRITEPLRASWGRMTRPGTKATISRRKLHPLGRAILRVVEASPGVTRAELNHIFGVAEAGGVAFQVSRLWVAGFVTVDRPGRDIRVYPATEDAGERRILMLRIVAGRWEG